MRMPAVALYLWIKPLFNKAIWGLSLNGSTYLCCFSVGSLIGLAIPLCNIKPCKSWYRQGNHLSLPIRMESKMALPMSSSRVQPFCENKIPLFSFLVLGVQERNMGNLCFVSKLVEPKGPREDGTAERRSHRSNRSYELSRWEESRLLSPHNCWRRSILNARFSEIGLQSKLQTEDN